MRIAGACAAAGSALALVLAAPSGCSVHRCSVDPEWADCTTIAEAPDRLSRRGAAPFLIKLQQGDLADALHSGDPKARLVQGEAAVDLVIEDVADLTLRVSVAQAQRALGDLPGAQAELQVQVGRRIARRPITLYRPLQLAQPAVVDVKPSAFQAVVLPSAAPTDGAPASARHNIALMQLTSANEYTTVVNRYRLDRDPQRPSTWQLLADSAPESPQLQRLDYNASFGVFGKRGALALITANYDRENESRELVRYPAGSKDYQSLDAHYPCLSFLISDTPHGTAAIVTPQDPQVPQMPRAGASGAAAPRIWLFAPEQADPPRNPIYMPDRTLLAQIALGDLDNDSRSDIVNIDAMFTATIWRQDRAQQLVYDAALSQAVTASLRPLREKGALRPVGLGIADMDEDGVADLTLAAAGDSLSQWSLYVLPIHHIAAQAPALDSGLTDQEPTQLGALEPFPRPSALSGLYVVEGSLVLGDVDHDGDRDVLLAARTEPPQPPAPRPDNKPNCFFRYKASNLALWFNTAR